MCNLVACNLWGCKFIVVLDNENIQKTLDVDLDVVLGSKVQPTCLFFEKILIVYFKNPNQH